MTKFHSDYFGYGFSRAEIEKFLERHGISIALLPPGISNSLNKSPAWAEELKTKEIFRAWQAACTLIGVNPYSTEADNIYHDERFNVAKDLLEEAARLGKIKAELNQGEYIFHQNDLREWAVSIHREWCIPPMEKHPSSKLSNVAPAPDNVIWESLQRNETENANLKVEKSKLTDSLVKAQETINQQNQQLLTASQKLKDSIRDVVKIQAELDELKADALEGKTKSTLQRALGGVVMTGYGKDIHASRIAGISEIVNDLASVGVSIKEDTLSKHLKAAAELITKPK